MLVDCHRCPVRDVHCGDCMVTAMLAPEGAELPLDTTERAAVTTFVQAGLVAPDEVEGLRARREPWGRFEAVG